MLFIPLIGDMTKFLYIVTNRKSFTSVDIFSMYLNRLNKKRFVSSFKDISKTMSYIENIQVLVCATLHYTLIVTVRLYSLKYVM